MQLIRACGWYMSLPKDPLHVVQDSDTGFSKTPGPELPRHTALKLLLTSLQGTVGHVSSPLKTFG